MGVGVIRGARSLKGSGELEESRRLEDGSCSNQGPGLEEDIWKNEGDRGGKLEKSRGTEEIRTSRAGGIRGLE